MFAGCWSPPPRIRSKGNHKYFKRLANKGVRKQAKLSIKGEQNETYIYRDQS